MLASSLLFVADRLLHPCPSKSRPIHPAFDLVPDAHFTSVSVPQRADWGQYPSSVHPFCRDLVIRGRYQQGYCGRIGYTSNVDDAVCKQGYQKGQLVFFSQIAQDWYLYTHHFTNLKRPGTYAEIATQNPVEGSNTFFYDACLGWKGLCVEANPVTHVQIHRVRSCELVPTCVSRTDGEHVSFLLKDDAGGIEHTNKNKLEWKTPAQKVNLVCMSLERMLTRRSITRLDYLSLDVEGHELEVLKGVNWNRTAINSMTIETTEESLPGIEGYLKSVGYKRHFPIIDEYHTRLGLLRRDAIFLRNDVVWGKPE